MLRSVHFLFLIYIATKVPQRRRMLDLSTFNQTIRNGRPLTTLRAVAMDMDKTLIVPTLGVINGVSAAL